MPLLSLKKSFYIEMSSGRSTHFTALSFPMIPHSGRQIWHRSVKLGNGLNKIGNFPGRAFGQLK